MRRRVQLLTLAEVRELHWRLLDARWKVAPHEDATDAEAPGNFRRHNIHPFRAGMVPPEWTDIEPRIHDHAIATTTRVFSLHRWCV